MCKAIIFQPTGHEPETRTPRPTTPNSKPTTQNPKQPTSPPFRRQTTLLNTIEDSGQGPLSPPGPSCALGSCRLARHLKSSQGVRWKTTLRGNLLLWRGLAKVSTCWFMTGVMQNAASARVQVLTVRKGCRPWGHEASPDRTVRAGAGTAIVQ